MGANENPSISVYVLPSRANDHGHDFWTLLAGTYRMIGFCRLVVLTSTIFHASIVLASPSDDNFFDEDLLFFTSSFDIGSCKSPSQSHVLPLPLLVVPNIGSVDKVIRILSPIKMLKRRLIFDCVGDGGFKVVWFGKYHVI